MAPNNFCFVLFQLQIYYHGQILAMNDCGYRQTYVAKYVLFQDLDEFVVPTVAEDWRSMLDEVSADDVASYSFRNRFYPLEFPDVVDQASVTSSDGPHHPTEYRLLQK